MKGNKPFLQLIQSFSPDASLTSTDALNHNIRTNQITAQIKQSYITHWQTQTQQQSKMQCYLSLKREYRTALPDRVLQIHRYTDSVLRQNTADPSHIYNSSRPGETSVSARRTQDLLCVCCSICVSLSP